LIEGKTQGKLAIPRKAGRRDKGPSRYLPAENELQDLPLFLVLRVQASARRRPSRSGGRLSFSRRSNQLCRKNKAPFGCRALASIK
jgi:hypothetical protein